MQGRPLTEVKEAFEASGLGRREWKAEGGERLPDVTDRARDYITDTTDIYMPAQSNAKDLSETPVRGLLVTHQVFIKEFLNVIHEINEEPYDDRHRAKNTALYIVRFARDIFGNLTAEILVNNDDTHNQVPLSEVCNN